MNTSINFSDIKSNNICIRKEAKTNGAMFDILILTSVTVCKETEKAIFVSGLTNDVNRNNLFMGAWLPKSILSINDDGAECSITLPSWANNKFEALS